LLGQNFIIAVLFTAEVLASISVLKEMGPPNPERWIFGIGLAAGLFWACSLLASDPAAQGGQRRNIWFWLVMFGYVAVVLAIGVYRAQNANVDADSAQATDWPLAVVMLATSIGWIVPGFPQKEERGSSVRLILGLENAVLCLISLQVLATMTPAATFNKKEPEVPQPCCWVSG